MRNWIGAGLALALLSGTAQAGESGDRLADALYSGTLGDLAGTATDACDAGEGDACFTLGLDAVINAFETLAQNLYRHGAVVPDSSAFGLLMGMGMPSAPSANPDPEPLTYDLLREHLDAFTAQLDDAATYMKLAGEGTQFVIPIEPLRVRIDLDGDGERGETETLGTLLENAGAGFDVPEPSGKAQSKGQQPAAPELVIGFDNADAYWFAGYSNITALPVDFLLAHDFTAFYDAFLHRVFPKAGLPMGNLARGGSLVIDADTDAYFADVIAAIHTASFPVADRDRLAGVLERASAVTALSRQNWEAILAETDDNFELVPSPTQTSLVPDQEVTEEIVSAWHQALDQIDRIIAGDLLVPHWRFTKGVNLKTYLETAQKTDLVLLFTGHDALPFLDDGPIAGADDFRELNDVMGDDWPLFAIWFN